MFQGEKTTFHIANKKLMLSRISVFANRLLNLKPIKREEIVKSFYYRKTLSFIFE